MATDETTPYKYSCRKCPIRRRCIDLSDNAPTIKSQIRVAFENRTDTLDMWAHLQIGCLLIKSDEEMAKKDTTESLLNRRLRRAREARQSAVNESKDEPAPPSKSPPQNKTVFRPSTLPPSKFPKDIRDPDQLTKREIQSAKSSDKRYWFILAQTGRHISLPVNGKMVMGRFDPNFGLPPDVDLSCQLNGVETVSRRHARVTAQGNIHFIEEMGSLSGVFVNSQKLEMGYKRRLYDGDIIVIGDCRLRYETVPYWIFNFAQYEGILYQLTIAHTGEIITLQPQPEQIIGRSDRFVNFHADIDLLPFGNLAAKVSRRHALLKYNAQSKQIAIEDMGSGFGTKVNGQLIMIGETHQLIPGDHIWLGGCVLAYDVQLR